MLTLLLAGSAGHAAPRSDLPRPHAAASAPSRRHCSSHFAGEVEELEHASQPDCAMQGLLESPTPNRFQPPPPTCTPPLMALTTCP